MTEQQRFLGCVWIFFSYFLPNKQHIPAFGGKKKRQSSAEGGIIFLSKNSYNKQ
jgi:hypothetical protein